MFENNGIKIRENFSKTIKFYKKKLGTAKLELNFIKNHNLFPTNARNSLVRKFSAYIEIDFRSIFL
jgi:hypothetical protein